MGILKSIFGDAADSISEAASKRRNSLQERYEQHKREVQERYEQHKNELRERYEQQKNEARSIRESEEIKTEYGIIKNGTLEIDEGITELKDGSLAKYKSLKKVIFPKSLTSLETHVFEDNTQLRELDFSKVTKLEYLPDAFVYGNSKISELMIPYGVKHVGSAVVCEIDKNHPLEVVVPATVREFEPFATRHAVTFRLFTPDIDIEWLIEDAEQFYVMEKDLSAYRRQMEEYGGDVPIGYMTDRCVGAFYSMVVGPEIEDDPKEEVCQAKDNSSQSETDEQIRFSPRVEALIKSAFRDGILTKKEKEIIIKRAVAEGEDADEFEMLLDSRIADEGIKEE